MNDPSTEPLDDRLSQLVGLVVAERYRLEALVGAGGMGAVYRARHLEAGFEVALKLIRPGLGRPVIQSRFLREARVTSRLRHPHVVTVVDFGRWKQHDSLYLAMEFVEGVSLNRLIDSQVLSIPMRLGLIDQALDALAHVHARGIVHRDVKPDNILVSRLDDGALSVKLTDFGIAACVDDTSEHLTRAGEALGTPAYMAPEVAAGAERGAGATSDLYAIGTLLYRILSGRLPFEGPGLGVMIAKASSDAPPLALRPEAADVGQPLVECVMRLLAKDPNQRPPMAADVRRALAPFIEVAVHPAEAWASLGGSLGPPDAHAVTRARAAAATVAGSKSAGAVLQLIGRQSELSVLGRLVDEVETGQQGRVALVMGEPGLGKSQMATTVLAELAEEGRFRVLRAVFRQGDPGSGGLRAAVEQELGTIGRSESFVRDAIGRFLTRHDDFDEREVDELCAYLRPPTETPTEAQTEAAQGRNFALVVRVLRRLARDRPVALGLDDLLAGGASAAAFLEYVLFEADYEPFPLFVLATSRPPAGDDVVAAMLGRSDRFEGAARVTIRVQALPIEVLADGLAEIQGLDPVAARRVAERSGGHPLFALHLARSAAGLTTTPATAPTPSEDSERGLPAPLQAIIDAELRRSLEASEEPERLREVVLQIAVLGDPVDVDLLESFVEAGGHSTDTLDDDLDALLDLRILTEYELGDAEFVSFTQRLTRDAVLAGLNRRRLRRYHRRAADVFIQQAISRDARRTMAGSIGDHLAAAGGGEEAVDWWLQAFSWEMCRGETLRAARWGLSAVALLEPSDPRWAETRRRLGRQLLDAGDLETAEDVLTPVVAGLDPNAAALAGDVLSDLYENRGDSKKWSRLLDELGAREQQMGPAARRALNRARAIFFNTMGRVHEGWVAAEASLVDAETPEELARGYQRLAFLAIAMGQGAVGLTAAEAAVTAAGEDEGLRIRALRARGSLRGWSGDQAGALRDHREVYETGRRSGRASRVPVALSDLAQTYYSLGDHHEALRYAEEAARTSIAMGLRTNELFASYVRIAVLVELGRVDEAEALLDRGVSMAREMGFPLLLVAESAFKALILAVRGDSQAAIEAVGAFGRPAVLPPLPAVAVILEGILDHVEWNQVSAEKRQLRHPMATRAVEIWEAIGNLARADRVRAFLDP